MSFFYFFKQKTAYELRISDWSSNVCSSDLAATTQFLRPVLEARGIAEPEDYVIWYSVQHLISRPNNTADAFTAHEHNVISDEALRTATGFGADDAPDDTMDPAIAMVLALVQEAPARAANPGMPAQIGRASCRDRVWPAV